MTVKELAKTRVMAQAQKIARATLDEQKNIEQIALVAERQARERLQKLLGQDGSAVSAGLVDMRIASKEPVISPQLLEEALPLVKAAAETTREARAASSDILTGLDDRLLVITGPCSIHDADAALEYAENVAVWRERYGDRLEIVMRAYPEKPRSELGWKGMVYDPRLDGSDDINLGLTLTRLLALKITELGVPIAMERLNALTPQYVNGLVAYDAIGARNVADQKSREYASGTSSPVGFKNGQDGRLDDAVSAIVSANGAHTFLGISVSGMSAMVRTTGNHLAHIILRGGKNGPNYSTRHIQQTKDALAEKGLLPAIIVDASHANSGKIAANQAIVIHNLAGQIRRGEDVVKGVMLESNLVAGNQKLSAKGDLVYGQSVTNECIDLVETERLLEQLAKAVSSRP